MVSHLGKRRALFCAPLPPEFDRESGSRRIYHLLELMRDAGWTVAFVCENAPADSPHVQHLRRMGIPTYVGFGGHTADLVAAGAFDVAVFAFWYLAERYADLVRRLSPGTRIVVESVDLHWLRNARRLLGGGDAAEGRLDAAFGSDFVSELNAYARADGVLTVSEKEAALVNDLTGRAGHARAVPDFDEVRPGTPSFGSRRGLVFVGNFRHPPNLDAVEHLCVDILPRLPDELRREHPVLIVGNGPGERVHELAEACGGVRVVGWVPSVEPYLRAARVSMVPLRYGAGTKRKLLQSLLAGTPTVTTSTGLEGIDLVDGEHLLRGDGAEAFAAGVERLLTDEELWVRLSRAGRVRVCELHGRGAARARMEEALEAVLRRPARALRAEEPAERAEAPAHLQQADDVRRAVDSAVPSRARVLVVSKGDPELLKLPGRTAAHFPQGADGLWAGYHPRDSRAALKHLEELRTDADYLVFPATSFWWLDYYAQFSRQLSERFERVWSDDSCVIFELTPQRIGSSKAAASGVGRTNSAAAGAGRTAAEGARAPGRAGQVRVPAAAAMRAAQ